MSFSLHFGTFDFLKWIRNSQRFADYSLPSLAWEGKEVEEVF
jgi:hypothetical protein